MDDVRILLITGSARRSSHTAALTRAIEALLGARGVCTSYWDPLDHPLPLPDPAYHHEPMHHPDPLVRDLVALADTADGFVLASPVYHNSYSSLLKLTLDHLAIGQFRYKPVGLVSHGERRNTQAVDHLRIVVRGLLAVGVPTQVCTCDDDYAETSEGYILTSSAILQRVQRFSIELYLFATHLRALRLQESALPERAAAK